jgi:Bacterial CdiA-CT RNAse A domain
MGGQPWAFHQARTSSHATPRLRLPATRHPPSRCRADKEAYVAVKERARAVGHPEPARLSRAPAPTRQPALAPAPTQGNARVARQIQMTNGATSAPHVGAVPVAAPGILLTSSEAAGGHLIARHVGKTAADLAARLVSEPRIPAASTFNTTAEAEAALQTWLHANTSQIAAWVAGGRRGNLALSTSFSGGSVLARGATSTTVGTSAQFVLKGQATGGGWYVLTGYPMP